MDSCYLFPKGPVQVSFLSGQLCCKSRLFPWTPDLQTQQPTQQVYDGLSNLSSKQPLSLSPTHPAQCRVSSNGPFSAKVSTRFSRLHESEAGRQSIIQSSVSPTGTCRFCSFSATTCWHSCNHFLARHVRTGPLYPLLQPAVNHVSFLLGSETSIRV